MIISGILEHGSPGEVLNNDTIGSVLEVNPENPEHDLSKMLS